MAWSDNVGKRLHLPSAWLKDDIDRDFLVTVRVSFLSSQSLHCIRGKSEQHSLDLFVATGLDVCSTEAGSCQGIRPES